MLQEYITLRTFVDFIEITSEVRGSGTLDLASCQQLLDFDWFDVFGNWSNSGQTSRDPWRRQRGVKKVKC